MANIIDRCFEALGDPMRRKLFEKLSKKSLSVAALADGLPITRPAVSQHLKILKEANLISVHELGTRRIYSIDHKGVRAIRAYLDRFVDQGLATFKEFIEKGK